MRHPFRFLAGALALAALLPAFVRAEVSWPIGSRTLGEVSDLVRHLSAIAPTTGVDGEPIHSPDDLQRFYRDREYRPAWMDASGVYLETADLLERLRMAQVEGLDPGRYHAKTIQNHLDHSEDLVQLAQLDLLLTDAFLTFGREVHSGSLDPRAIDPLWRIAPAREDMVKRLQEALEAREVIAALDALAPPHEGYRRLRLALAHHQAIERRGGWPSLPPGKTLLKKGVRDPRVAVLRWRLVVGGELSEEPVADESLFDGRIDKALRRFQQRHGIEPDGAVGEGTRRALNVPVGERVRQIELNMARWRWLPRELPARYAMVNMAGFELSLVENNLPVREMRVIVGRDQRQTPVMESRITSLVINPYWYVPETVLHEDLLPQLVRDPELLRRLDLKVFRDLRGSGHEVDAATIDWKRYVAPASRPFPYTLRQEPGPTNALGRIKFLLADSPAIYLHDTPDPNAFSRRSRALSSGCIRLQEPLLLAEYLLGNGWDGARIAERIARGQPQQIDLENPLPIYLVYWTAWVNELNELHFREDVYGRDAAFAAIRERAGTEAKAKR